MKIVRDEPPLRLELAETEPRLTWGAGLIALALLVVIATPWRGLWAMAVHGARRDVIDPVPSAIWFGVWFVLLASVLGGRRFERLAVRRDTGRVEWHSSYLAGLVRWGGRAATDDIVGLSLGIVPGPRTARDARALPLRLALRASPESGARDTRLELRVEAVDRNEEVADLALRLGAAAGLRFYRVQENEQARFEIELVREPREGFAALPAALGHSDPEDDHVSEAAARATNQERLRRFDPVAFRGSARVSVWEPGREVRFDKGWNAWLLLAPFLLFALLGPLAYFRLPSLQTMPILPRVAALSLISLIGLALAVVGWTGIISALPRRVRLDWSTRALEVATLRERRQIPFAEIAAIELRPHVYRTPTTRGGLPRVSFRSEVWAVRRSQEPPADELLVETPLYRDDPDTPRSAALPLATELAEALGVARRETESSRR